MKDSTAINTITMKDIARLVGVSKTSVSHYINGRYEYMSPETRIKIEKTVHEQNYRPNSLARSLKSKKSGLVGILLPDLHGPGIIKVLNGLNNILSENNFNPIIYVYNANSRETREKCLQTCIDQRVEGIIVNMDDDDLSLYTEISDRGIPVVLIGGVRDYWKYDAVYIDHYTAAWKMMEHLDAQAYRKVYLLCEDPGSVYMQGLRKKAYMDYIQSTGMQNRETFIYTIDIHQRNSNMEIHDIVTDILSMPSKEHRAIFVDSSSMLKMLLMEFKKEDVKIPHQIGVCGYDAWDWAALVDPGITAVSSSSYEMAREAAKLLVDRIKSSEFQRYKRIIIDADLIERGSTKCY